MTLSCFYTRYILSILLSKFQLKSQNIQNFNKNFDKLYLFCSYRHGMFNGDLCRSEQRHGVKSGQWHEYWWPNGSCSHKQGQTIIRGVTRGVDRQRLPVPMYTGPACIQRRLAHMCGWLARWVNVRREYVTPRTCRAYKMSELYNYLRFWFMYSY